MAPVTNSAGRPVAADLADRCRALSVPHLAEALPRLAERARAEGWTHEEFLAACLELEIAARRSGAGETRIRKARLPARKTLEEYDVHRGFQKPEVIARLGALDFVEAKRNVVFLGPPGSGKTHLAIGICIRACEAGYRVAFATVAEWVDRLALARSQGRLHEEVRRLGRYPLLVLDEVGYVCFDPDAASLLFHLVSSRYERGSVVVTSNKAFSRWPEVFGNATIATGMKDRLLHHADVVCLERGETVRDRAEVPFDDNPLAPEGAFDCRPPGEGRSDRARI